MKKSLTTIIALIIYLTLPVIFAYIIAKLFMKNEGTILAIIFISLIVLELVFVAIKVIRYKKSKLTNKEYKAD